MKLFLQQIYFHEYFQKWIFPNYGIQILNSYMIYITVRENLLAVFAITTKYKTYILIYKDYEAYGKS